MSRTDYLDDEEAPRATSIVVAASAFVANSNGAILLIRRADSGLFALPGGRHELGETMTETAVRETLEETGVHVRITGLVGIYSNPRHVVEFSDGEVRQEFSICFRAVPVSGEPRSSSESTDVQWVEIMDVPALSMHPSIRLRIEHALSNRTEPFYT